MRLLNIDTLKFTEFSRSETTPPYIVTSHRWTSDEVTYKDIAREKKKDSVGYKKILGFCAIARAARSRIGAVYDRGRATADWIWIDTCCIDKRSSAEVSESINSMCTWYEDAVFCLAFLADVPPSWSNKDFRDYFPRSEWFKRGWTLQELLAPVCVVFLNSGWEVFGHKCSYGHMHKPCLAGVVLNPTISKITGVPERVLLNFYVRHDLTFQSRMLWTSGRQTTKPEDQAYSLLGIFDVFMPLLYGEGSNRAMRRLEEEFKKRHPATFPGTKSSEKVKRWDDLAEQKVVDRAMTRASMTTKSGLKKTTAHTTETGEGPTVAARSEQLQSSHRSLPEKDSARDDKPLPTESTYPAAQDAQNEQVDRKKFLIPAILVIFLMSAGVIYLGEAWAGVSLLLILSFAGIAMMQ